MRNHSKFIAMLLTAAAVSPALPATPADRSELEALRAQVQALEQQIAVLSQKLDLKDQAPVASPAAPAPKIAINDQGFSFASADGANALKLRGLVQLDSRLFFNDGGLVNNAFALRRARLIAEGTFDQNYSFQLVPEFGGSSVSILDANFSVAVDPALQVKFGKFKVPVGLELLQSDSWTFFDERSLVTNLVPNRDLGVQAAGEWSGGTFIYTLGVFNGVADSGSTTNTDFDNDKDAVARLLVSPFKHEKDSLFRGLSVGVAASLGREKTTAGRTAGYKTDGQQTFFAYNSAVVADGQNWRFSPQFDYRHGPFGAIGEYVVSTVNVRPSAIGAKTELQNKAWQLAAGYMLTGEDSSPTGVKPAANFDFANGTWGAFELAARYANFRVDDRAFPLLASASANADQASAIGLGLNWYASKVVRLTFDLYQTNFGFNSAAPAVSANPILRQDEQAFLSRFQLSF